MWCDNLNIKTLVEQNKEEEASKDTVDVCRKREGKCDKFCSCARTATETTMTTTTSDDD